MPLSEFYRLAAPIPKVDAASQEKSDKPLVSADLSPVHQSDFAELVWENGQLLKQGQSSRHKRVPTPTSNSNSLPSHSPKIRESGMGNGAVQAHSIVNEVPLSRHMDLDQDEEMVHWLGYPMNQTVHDDYSEFLPEFSTVTFNELPSHNNFMPCEKRGSGAQSGSYDLCTTEDNAARVEQVHLPKVSAQLNSEAVRPKSGTTTQPCQNFMCFRPRISNNICGRKSDPSADHSAFVDSLDALTSAGAFPRLKVYKQGQAPSGSNYSILNFSHFSRPAALSKSSLQNTSHVTGTVRIGSKDKASAIVSSHFAEGSLVDPSTSLTREIVSAIGKSKENKMRPDAKPLDRAVNAEAADAIVQNVNVNDCCASKTVGDSRTSGSQDREKPVEPAVASSSVCSVSSVEDSLNEQHPRDLKRKHGENDESECPSEDAEEDSAGVEKPARVRGPRGSKRGRAVEVHNLSERRRRDRINEKMRALQELIPNCNKVDKASMLDEAIEYLRTLQLQVQIMSMGAGLYMSPMIFPSGMQHMHAAHMAQFSPIAMGPGMGFGMGYGMRIPEVGGGNSCPMVQMPPMHGSAFPGTQMASQSPMVGSSVQLFGIPGQALPMSMQRAPLVPLAEGPFMNPCSGANDCAFLPLDNMNPTFVPSSKNSVLSIKLHGMQSTCTNITTPGESEVANGGLKQPASAQDSERVSEVTPVVPFSLSNGNDEPEGTAVD